MATTIGVVPAAGIGSRMWPYRGTKELIQVGYRTLSTDEGTPGARIPMTAVEHTLLAMRRGGIDTALIILSPNKWDIFRYLGCGDHLGIHLAYLCQEEASGMPGALALARSLTETRTVCMGMPDTLLEPPDCYMRLLRAHRERAADLTLGVFATDDPRSAAPVILDPATGQVRDIADKPERPAASNTWGIAAWSPAFTELLHDYVSGHDPGNNAEWLMSDVFSAAGRAGLAVYGVSFEPSQYRDIGTPQHLIDARAALEPARIQIATADG